MRCLVAQGEGELVAIGGSRRVVGLQLRGFALEGRVQGGELRDGFLGQGEDPDLYSHNDNIYQTFLMIFIAALMVDLGKVRYQPADAQDEQDLEIADKASTIQAFNERKNKIAALHQLKLLYLWTCGSFFRYIRYTIDKKKWKTSMTPQYQTKPVKVTPDGDRKTSCRERVSSPV